MKQDKKSEKRGLLKVAGMMMGCCIAPIIVVMLLTFFGNAVGLSLGSNKFIPFISSLICPLMMIGAMFFMMGKGKGNCCEGHQKDDIEE